MKQQHEPPLSYNGQELESLNLQGRRNCIFDILSNIGIPPDRKYRYISKIIDLETAERIENLKMSSNNDIIEKAKRYDAIVQFFEVIKPLVDTLTKKS